jgi:hypothetical protein
VSANALRPKGGTRRARSAHQRELDADDRATAARSRLQLTAQPDETELVLGTAAFRAASTALASSPAPATARS